MKCFIFSFNSIVDNFLLHNRDNGKIIFLFTLIETSIFDGTLFFTTPPPLLELILQEKCLGKKAQPGDYK